VGHGSSALVSELLRFSLFLSPSAGFVKILAIYKSSGKGSGTLLILIHFQQAKETRREADEMDMDFEEPQILFQRLRVNGRVCRLFFSVSLAPAEK
jgi:hypothetical protein